jgi:hypothetical protein
LSTTIVCLSGRKQGGKGTLAKFLVDNATLLFGAERYPPVYMDLEEREIGCEASLEDATAKVYSFAGPIKEFCHKVMGLTYEQCYGSDADKNTLTRYWWEDMPHYPRIVERVRQEADKAWLARHRLDRFVTRRLGNMESCFANYMTMKLPTGQMTARQVLQEFGTGIGRQMYGNIWVEATLRAIQSDGCALAVIDDCRFPNEVEGVKSVGGYVFRLTRAPFKDDEHISEKALDDFSRFDGWVMNHKLNKQESCIDLLRSMTNLGMFGDQSYRAISPELVGPDGPLFPSPAASKVKVVPPRTMVFANGSKMVVGNVAEDERIRGTDDGLFDLADYIPSSSEFGEYDASQCVLPDPFQFHIRRQRTDDELDRMVDKVRRT